MSEACVSMKNFILIVIILVRCNNKDVVLNVSKDD
jgi:hypothetical protein